MRCYKNKKDVIDYHEIGLHSYFKELKLNVHIEYSDLINPTNLDEKNNNCLHAKWRELLKKGFPFVKRELLLYNPLSHNIDNWEVFLLSHGFSKKSISSIIYQKNNSVGKKNHQSNYYLDYHITLTSLFFDEKYYSNKYHDLVKCEDLVDHFIRYGWKEGRNPSAIFDVQKYMSKNNCWDINPLVHYHIYRSIDGAEPEKPPAFEYTYKNFVKNANALIIDDLPNISKNNNKIKWAILAHVHYEDLVDEIIIKAKECNCSNLLLTTNSKEKEKIILRELKNKFNGDYHVRIVPNTGRDVAPFFNEFTDKYFDFQLICKLHTKKSPHISNGSQWRTYLFDNLLPNEVCVENFLNYINCGSALGLSFPVPMSGTSNDDWGANRDIANKILERLNLNKFSIDQELVYPSATMFWFKPCALKKIFNALTYDNFECEPLPFDGTTAHAIERLIPVFTENNNKTYFTTVMKNNFAVNHAEKKLSNWVGSSQTKETKYLILSHEASNTGAPKIALQLQKHLQKISANNTAVILLKGGPLLEKFLNNGMTINFDGCELDTDYLKFLLYGRRDIKVICNTVVTSWLIPIFKECGLTVINLVHEFASCGYFPIDYFAKAFKYSDKVIYPGNATFQDTKKCLEIDNSKVLIRAQGIYSDDFPQGDPIESRINVRKEIGVDENSFIFLGCGTVEHRKGFDIFVDLAVEYAEYYPQNDNFCFVWIGPMSSIDSEQSLMNRSLLKAKTNPNLSGKFFYLGNKNIVDKYFLASDAFLLTSRMDPFPGVVLEAMACGMPILCFKESTDIAVAFINNKGGWEIGINDYKTYVEKMNLLYQDSEICKSCSEFNRSQIKQHYRFDSYARFIVDAFNVVSEKYISLAYDNENTLISFILPIFNPKIVFLQQLLNCMRGQSLGNWELCIADGSTNEEVKALLQYYSILDNRIKVKFLEYNLGISGNTNEAIKIANGSHIALLDHDDLLTFDCVEELNRAIKDADPDFLYTDEDKTDEGGVSFYDPVYKPDFSWERIEKNNYITHLSLIKKNIVDQVGLFDQECDGAQDYDFILRSLEVSKKIVHLPKILYHWRMSSASTAGGDINTKMYAIDAGKRALEKHLIRRGITDKAVVPDVMPFTYKFI